MNSAAAATINKTGALTGTSLTGLGLEAAINYASLEKLNIWLGFGDNVFTINSTHATETTLNTASGADRIIINNASGLLIVNGEQGNDIFDVRATSLGSDVRLNGQEGADTFNLSDLSPALPTSVTSGEDRRHRRSRTSGWRERNSTPSTSTISANTANKAGTLTSTTLRGLEMPAGLNYANTEDFNLWLGTGTDGLYIASTHFGTTDVFMGNGNSTVNQRDDTVAISSIGGITTIHGQGGNDFFYVNVEAAADDPGFDAQFRLVAAGTANDNQIDALFHRTNANGIGAVLNLHGEGNSDQYNGEPGRPGRRGDQRARQWRAR